MRMRVAIAGAVALMGCTASAEVQTTRADRELAKELEGRTAGTPTDCISASNVQGPQVIDHDTLLYRESGRTIWRNELASECRSLAPMNTIVIELHGGQICRNDQFRVLEPGTTIPGPYCRLGKFVPYRK
ncbi:MAG: DUF6491 family protein [Pseudomonadota bacterium]